MSTQITVRLPDELVDDMDQQVHAGQARSRASVVEQALLAELRRRRDNQDAEIYRRLAAERAAADQPAGAWAEQNAAQVLADLS